jgi:hypothetical protein
MAQYGQYIHSLCERWAKGELEIYELLDEYEKHYYDNVTEQFPNLRNGEYLGDRYYQDGYKFFSEFGGIGDYKIVSVEEKFEIEIEDFIFTGFIDLLLEDENGDLIVWDWKSKGEFADEEEEQKYRKQLYLYSYYVNRKYGKFPAKTVFYCFRRRQEYARPFDMDEYNHSIEWMLDTVKEIKKLYCQYDYFYCSQLCGHRHLCKMKQEIESNPYWKQVQKDSKPKKIRSAKSKKKEG